MPLMAAPEPRGLPLAVAGLRVAAPGGRVLLSLPALDLPAGRSLAVRGPSGAGKSTLLHALAGLLEAEGAVRWGATDLLSLPASGRAAFRRARVGLVFQDFLLFEELGAIVASSTLPPSFAEAFRDAGMPVVHSFGRYTTSPHVHVVGIDNIACGRMAAETLMARGYRRVAFLGGPEMATSTQDRARGFVGALSAHADVSVSLSYASAYSFDAGRVEMTRRLMENPSEAYFCGDDVLSIGALSAITEVGLRVPDDIGIIGLNDMDMARWQNINLTTIRQPVAEIIGASIDLVVATIERPDRHPETRLFPCRVIERGTLRPVPAR